MLLDAAITRGFVIDLLESIVSCFLNVGQGRPQASFCVSVRPTAGISARSQRPSALADQILILIRNLPKRQQDVLFRAVKQERKPHKPALDPAVQGLATKVSPAELRRQLILEQEMRPLQDQLASVGFRKQGPTPAHRFIESKVKPFRSDWRHLAKEDKNTKVESKRREIRVSDEFARLFPAEAREARKLAGIEPLILIEM
jgi:hypothetical protein